MGLEQSVELFTRALDNYVQIIKLIQHLFSIMAQLMGLAENYGTKTVYTNIVEHFHIRAETFQYIVILE